MRKTVLTLLLLATMLSAYATREYASSSVLSAGSWYKIAVESSGVYKLTYSDIRDMGIGDPAGVRIYGYGGNIIDEDFTTLLPKHPDDLPEIPIYMHKGADGVFSEGDYILFYGQGVIKDEISEENGHHVYTDNYYSKSGYYFVTTAAGEGKRITPRQTVTEEAGIDFSTTNAGYFIKKAEYNVGETGRVWFGYKFQGSTKQQTFVIKDNHIDTSESMHLSVNVMAHSTTGKTSFALVYNGESIGTTNISPTSTTNQYGYGGLIERYLTVTSSSNPQFDITYTPRTSSDIGYINFITANYIKRLELDNNSALLITNPDKISAEAVAKYHISGGNAGAFVWDITDPLNVTSVPFEYSGELTFKEKHDKIHKYLAFNNCDVAKEPVKKGLVPNQNLHAITEADMVIVSPTSYISASNRLAQFHREHDGMKVVVVTPEQVNNEFSSGTPDASATRLFMKMLYDRRDRDKNSLYLLFMGTTSYDNRGILHSPLELVSYQSQESLNGTNSYTTDDFYAMLEDNEGGSMATGTMDICVGRLPVTTPTEAENVVTKTINYVTKSAAGSWRSLCTFLADDGDNNTHCIQADQLAQMVNDVNGSYSVSKIYLDAYQKEESSSGDSFPGAQKKALDNIKDGTLIFTYVGHGSPNTLTTEQTITKNIISSMYNKNLGLWLTATCDFARYDDNKHSAGMEVLLNKDGGGIALYTTTRVVFSSDNFLLMKAAYKYLLPKDNERHKTIGEILRLAKRELSNNQNKLNFTLLGDPAIKLHYPTNNIITDEINGTDPSEATLSALGIVSIKGHVEDLDGNELTDYNGDLNITVYDKSETMRTLGQTGDPFEYEDYPNKLFSGKVSVTDGRFSAVFMVPKDINYNFGNGKLVYYAYDKDNPDNDGFGNNTEFTVGGSDPTAEDTDESPSVRIYMNQPEFESGDHINESPVFFAHLYDKYGINVVGAGIGHDIVANVSGPEPGSYVLNNYYTSTLDDYKSGIVKYQFNDLKEGTYYLDFKAWNLQNISATANLAFTVDSDAKPHILDYWAYPNPATEYIDFYLRYDRVDTPVTVEFTVYDVTYRKYWSSEAKYSGDGTYTAHFDLSGKYGNMASGVYWVRAKIIQDNGILTHQVRKFIIKTK